MGKFKYKKSREEKITFLFEISYGLLAALALLLLILSAFDVVSISKIFFFLFVVIILMLMLANNLLLEKDTYRRQISYLAFGINAIMIGIYIYFPVKWLLFLIFLYNFGLLIFIELKYWHFKTYAYEYAKTDTKIRIVLSLIELFCCSSVLDHTYLGGYVIFLYAFIPMTILLGILAILAFTKLKKTFGKFCRKISTKICLTIVFVFLSWWSGVVFIDMVNTTFPLYTRQYECVVVDKYISTGSARSKGSIELSVEFQGRILNLEVSKDTYHSKQINDLLLVNYYSGALGLSYCESAE